MIIEEMSNLVESLQQKMSAEKVAKIFGKERKWTFSIKNGCNFRIDYGLIAGLKSLGYEIKIVKINNK